MSWNSNQSFALESSALMEALWGRDDRPMGLIDSGHRYVEVNRGYEKFFGRGEGAYAGVHLREILGEDQYEKVSKPPLERCLKGERVTFESSFFYPGVGLRHVRIDYTPLDLNRTGSTDHVLSTVFDISDLKKVETHLREESKWLHAVIEGTRAGTWQWSPVTNEMKVNERWAEMLGYDLDELQPIDGETWFSLLHPDDRAVSVRESMAHVSGETDFYDCELRVKHKDGHWVWVHTRGLVSDWQDGKPRWVYGTHTDITERKLEEERRREIREALVAREGQLSDIIKSVPGALIRYLWTADGEEQILYFSEKAMDLWEISEEEATDAKVLWGMVNEEYIDGLTESLRLSAKQESYWEQTWKITTPRGYVKWLNGRGYPRKQGDGSVVWNTLILNVTQLKETEGRLRESEAQARAADAAKTDFLNMMNHELRTPLNAIIGPLDVLASEVTNHEQRSIVDMMRPAADHLLSLINDILSLSKIQADKHDVQIVETKLSDIISEVLHIFKHQAAQKGLEYRIECRDRVPELIRTDPMALKQILMNLVSNAIKFTDEGGVYIDIFAVRTDSGSRQGICFNVQDTGIGIASEDIDKVFRPFEQVDMALARAYQGTGLGIPIASELAQLLGGELSLTSESGVGSAFALSLPLDVEPDHAADAKPVHGALNDLDSGPDELAILVIEDSKVNIDFFKLVFSRLGRSADYAEDGQSGIDQFGARDYDVVFCDIRLPDMSGEIVAQEIRKMRGGRGCAIIANTAYATDEFKAELLAQGFDGFLPKPMKVADVDQALSSCLASGA